jgi:adenine phosphoribosyltransferase
VAFAARFLERFRWVDGHADVLGMLADGSFLAEAAVALAAPFRDGAVTKVAGIEARGFVLGTAVALELGTGFVPVRKAGSIHPGPKATARSGRDWRGNEHELQVQRAVLARSDRVLLVDDWIETGSQAAAARTLIEDCGAGWAGLSVLVDQAGPERTGGLEAVAAVVSSTALPLPG